MPASSWLAVILLVSAASSTPAAQAGGPRERSGSGPFARIVAPRLAGTQCLVSEDALYLGVLESEQGQQDLSGDLDAADTVLHRVSLPDGTVTNLGVVGALVSEWNGLVLIATFEGHQGSDLNGDGDQGDTVLRLVENPAGAVTSSNLALGWTRHARGLAAFGAREAHQGASGTDLNGDGDSADIVLHVWKLGLSAPENLELGVPDGEYVTVLSGGQVVFFLAESEVGDRNGDGDALDRVLHVYDAGAGVLQNQALAARAVPGGLRSSASTAAFLVSEAQQGGTDLNGDGDALDDVVHVYSVAGGVESLGLAGGRSTDGIRLSDLFTVAGERTVLNVSEAAQGGADLNGDGDALDLVLFAHDSSTGTTMPLGLPGSSIFSIRPLVASDELAISTRREADAGADLNGDGDVLDSVLVLRRFDAPAPLDTGLALDPFLGYEVDWVADGPWVALRVDEEAQGGLDRNGDGEALDRVHCIVDSRTGTIRNLALAGSEPASLIGGIALLHVSEGAQGAQDLNGDGDAADGVLFHYDADLERLANLRAKVNLVLLGPRGTARTRAFLTEEDLERDLNDDGNALDDRVIRVVLSGGRF